MANAIRFHEIGTPSVMRWEEIEVGRPGAGEVRVRHEAVGLNFADTYFRSGLYPAQLPAGMGVEGAGVVEEIGEGVVDFAVGDRVTYTGSPLGAYATERIMASSDLIALPDGIAFDTAAAMTMRGLTAAYLLRRIYPLKAGDTVLLHAAAGGVGLIFTQWAKLLGIKVIGTVSSDEKASVARAHGCDEVVIYTREDVVARVKEITGASACRLSTTVSGNPRSTSLSIALPGGGCWCASERRPDRLRRFRQCSWQSRDHSSSHVRLSPITSRIPKNVPNWRANCSHTSSPGESRSRSTSDTPSKMRCVRTTTWSPVAVSVPPSSPSEPKQHFPEELS